MIDDRSNLPSGTCVILASSESGRVITPQSFYEGDFGENGANVGIVTLANKIPEIFSV